MAQLQHPLVSLLRVAAAVALAGRVVDGRGGWPMDAAVIAVVVLLSTVLAWMQEAQAQGAVAALARWTEASSSVLRDGMLVRIASAALADRPNMVFRGTAVAQGSGRRLGDPGSPDRGRLLVAEHKLIAGPLPGPNNS